MTLGGGDRYSSHVTRGGRRDAGLMTARHYHDGRTWLGRRRLRLGGPTPTSPRRRAAAAAATRCVDGVMARHVHVVASQPGEALAADGAPVRPVGRHVVLPLGVTSRALRPRERLAAHVAAVRVDVLAGAAAVRRSQVLRQLAGARERRRAAPAGAPSLRGAVALGRGRRSVDVRALVVAQPVALAVRATAHGARVAALRAVTPVVLLQLVLAFERLAAAGRAADVRTGGRVPRGDVPLKVLALDEAPVALRARVNATRLAAVDHGPVTHERRALAERASALVTQHGTRLPGDHRAAPRGGRTSMSRDAMRQDGQQVGEVVVARRAHERRLAVTGPGHVTLVVCERAECGATGWRDAAEHRVQPMIVDLVTIERV